MGDAKVGLAEISHGLGEWAAPKSWTEQARSLYARWNAYVDQRSGPTNAEVPTYAHVVGAVNRLAGERDLALTAAGGMPGELEMNWKAKGIATFDCEFGFSCMGYEIAGGWGAKMADPSREVFVMVGDGSYLLMNSDIYSSVLTGMKLIVVVCDNGGFLVIDRLQRAKGIPSFNNSIETCRTAVPPFRVDFARHAEAMGAVGIRVGSMGELDEANKRAQAADRTTVIHVDVHPTDWSGNDNSWWECGTPEVSERDTVARARKEQVAGKKRQRLGV